MVANSPDWLRTRNIQIQIRILGKLLRCLILSKMETRAPIARFFMNYKVPSTGQGCTPHMDHSGRECPQTRPASLPASPGTPPPTQPAVTVARDRPAFLGWLASSLPSLCWTLSQKGWGTTDEPPRIFGLSFSPKKGGTNEHGRNVGHLPERSAGGGPFQAEPQNLRRRSEPLFCGCLVKRRAEHLLSRRANTSSRLLPGPGRTVRGSCPVGVGSGDISSMHPRRHHLC